MESIQLCGTVKKGKQMGQKLGFPTANIDIPQGVQCPSNGVYVGVVRLADGSDWPCVLNQGKHPTLPGGGASIEAHLLNFDGDLYGERITIIYLKKLRDEKKFESIEALKAQVNRDKETAQRYFEENPLHEGMIPDGI